MKTNLSIDTFIDRLAPVYIPTHQLRRFHFDLPYGLASNFHDLRLVSSEMKSEGKEWTLMNENTIRGDFGNNAETRKI
jgi:hypothetical protein